MNNTKTATQGGDEDAFTLTDQELSEHFGEPQDTMADHRSNYFAILFLGLGIGSVLIGLSLLGPVFPMIGKIVIFVTIISSFLGPFLWERYKNKKAMKKAGSENIEKSAE
ncbi:MAG: hypothetical protein ACLFR0_05070 [Alphaproteobacteria bacterium]